jgi:phospholipase C
MRRLAAKVVSSAGALAISGAVLAGGGVLSERASGAPTLTPPTAVLAAVSPQADIHKIQHVVVIMQENRSFDEYFGTYPGADGIPMGADGTPSVCNPDPSTNTCVKPYHDPTPGIGAPHGWTDAQDVVDGGKMDGFIKDQRVAYGNKIPPYTMGYKIRADIPNYWSYADDYVLADHMFQSDSSWSDPAHMYLVSGWGANCQVDSGLFACRSELTNPGTGTGKQYHWATLPHLLYENGTSWGYYIVNGQAPDCDDLTLDQCPPMPNNSATPGIWNPLPKFVDTVADNQTGNIQGAITFLQQAHDGTLPAVSWVIPNAAVSEHPPNSPASGQAYTTYLINTIMKGPDWDSTAIFLTWDDWGGFYDHLAPPTGIDANQYGPRLPALMISPYAKQGYVDHQTLSFDAYLKFIEDDFLNGQRIDPETDGEPDNRTSVREKAPQLGDLSQEFDFSQAPRPPVLLPVNAANISDGATRKQLNMTPGAQGYTAPGAMKPAAAAATTTSTAKSTTPTTASAQASTTAFVTAPATTRGALASKASDQKPFVASTADAADLSGQAPLGVRFDMSQTDIGGDPAATWTLDYGDGRTATAGVGQPPPNITVLYGTPGNYTATLTVSSAEGTSSATRSISVQPRPVRVWLSEDDSVPAAGVTTVNFDGSQSGSGQWTLDFGDGTPVVSGGNTPPADIPHVYAAVGVFHAVLTVTGGNGLTNHATAIITPVGAHTPQIVPIAPSAITKNRVTFSAKVNQVNYWYFQYGLTTAYGSRTQAATLNPNANLVTVSAMTTRTLKKATTYHYQLVVVNRTGTFTSPDATFTTAS